jgi:hypothetical protein
MPVKKKKMNVNMELTIRPSLPTHEMRAFQAACYDVGETMTSVVRRLAIKVAAGDKELLQRIRS